MNGKDYRDQADDLVYRMRNLAGTGDVDRASEIMRSMFKLVNDAHRLDRDAVTQSAIDESNMTLSYVIEMSEICADNIRGLPKGNRSRAAKRAA